MYQYLTDGSTSESQNLDIDKRLEMMLDDPDVDLVVDKRELNQGRKSNFEAFWKEVDMLLEEQVASRLPEILPYRLSHGFIFSSGQRTDSRELPNVTVANLMSSIRFKVDNFVNRTLTLDTVLSFFAICYTCIFR